MKVKQMLDLVSIKILIYLSEKGELRHRDLSKLTNSRGTLALSLKDLEEEGLVQRKVVNTKPLQTFYSLTEKGIAVGKELHNIKELIHKNKSY